MTDPKLVREFVLHAMLLHPDKAKEIAAQAAADPEGTAALAAEYAAADASPAPDPSV